MTLQAFRRLHGGRERPQNAKEWVAKVIDNHWVETCIMVLVVIDLVVTATEAGVDANLICIHGQVAGGKGAGPEAVEAAGGGIVETPKASPMHFTQIQQHLDTDSAPAFRAYTRSEPHGQEESHAHGEARMLVCETAEGPHAEHLLHFCHVCSTSILCIFLVELLLKWWANPTEFLAGWCHKLDLFVVSTSLFIDTAVVAYIETQHESASRQREEKETVAIVSFLLILSRCWRVVRICHGFFEQYQHFHEEAEKEAERPREENKILRKALQRLGADPDEELEKAKLSQGHGYAQPPWESREDAVY